MTVVSDARLPEVSHGVTFTDRPSIVGFTTNETVTIPNEAKDTVHTSPFSAPKREPGKPSPGRQRRTKEEIAEDDRHFASLSNDLRTFVSNEATAMAATVPDETAAKIAPDPQDEADERAESEARRGDKLTREDVRAAVERYTQKHGVAAAVENIGKIIGGSVSEIPDDQKSLQDAIDEIMWAVDEPLKTENKTPVATKDDVIEVMKVYMKKYDGVDDPKKATHTGTDIPAILKKLFGPGVERIGQVPPTPEAYGSALAAINEAVSKNTFNRAAK